MSVDLLGVSWFVGTGLLFWPVGQCLTRSSEEAERMFSLVQSGREDKRNVPETKAIRIVSFSLLRLLRKRWRFGDGSRLSKRLAAAGLRSSSAEEVFLAAQLLSTFCAAVAGWWLAGGGMVGAAAGAVCGGALPGIWLGMRKKTRRSRIRKSVPDMVDLLLVCVGAGLGLDQALLRIGMDLQLSHPEMAEELDRISLERQAGTPRIEAWRAFAERAAVDELFLFTGMLAETERFGTPITKALDEFAEDLRTKRKQRAEEAAAKTKVKIIFPLVLCIFPSIFVVLLLPALLSLIRNFSGMNR